MRADKGGLRLPEPQPPPNDLRGYGCPKTPPRSIREPVDGVSDRLNGVEVRVEIVERREHFGRPTQATYAEWPLEVAAVYTLLVELDGAVCGVGYRPVEVE